MPIGIAAYSFPFSCGWAKRDGRPAFPQPIRSPDLIALAVEHGLKSIAFPSISTGVYGYPLELAAPIAVRTPYALAS
jgi:hypothetical protein